MSELVTRPISRYYGSKWRVAPQIVAMLPVHDLWVDAFCGLYDRLLADWCRVSLNGGRDQTNARREEVVWMNFQPSGGGSW